MIDVMRDCVTISVMKAPMPESEIAQRIGNIKQYNRQMADTPHHVSSHQVACLLAEWRREKAPVKTPMSPEEVAERVANARSI